MALTFGTPKTAAEELKEFENAFEKIINAKLATLNIPTRGTGGDRPVLTDYFARALVALEAVPVHVLADQTVPAPGAPAPDPAVPTAPTPTPTGTAPLPPPALPARPAAPKPSRLPWKKDAAPAAPAA